MKYCYMETPLGILYLSENEDGINQIQFVDEIKENHSEDSRYLDEAMKQLGEYFEGNRKEFDFPLSLEGTEWQKKVWNALMNIPYGETASYAEIAQRAGNPKASRAVGAANHANPLLIVIPCHRVINKNGRLGGYAAGLKIKKELLALEKSK